jgi:Protein of unknown function (DUF4238)
MEYPEVENGHIVPAGYLRGFADGSMIIRNRVRLGHERERREKKTSVKSVGTRKRPYSRLRPRDGSRIDDVEASISILENRVGVVRGARGRFPFCEGDRSTVAQFAGAQQVRGPKWARVYERLVDEARADAERAGMSKAAAEHDAELLAGATSRLISMQRWLYGFSALFFAMRWTLVEFARPALITCDHPVVLWDAANRACAPTDLSGTGVKDLLEVRYPLNSTSCLLMTWLGGGDDPQVVRGNKALARNINSFTRAAAEDEWFNLPETKPPFSDERSRILPLSTQIYGEYPDRQIADRRRFGIKLAFESKDQPLQNAMSFKAYYPEKLRRCGRMVCGCKPTTS